VIVLLHHIATSQNAQIKAALFPSKQPVMVSTQAWLRLKVATVSSFALNRGIVTDIMPATFLEPE